MPIKFTQAINQALRDAMTEDESVIVIGEGVPDPKAIFETTRGLQEAFGKQRVFDMPLSENAMTGVCLGVSLQGLRPVLTHQRIDFSLLAMDQMVNHAAKWHYMFNGLQKAPMVIRTIIGKGWGQGPQHSQALWGMLAQVPGLKIALPSSAQEAYQMMRLAIEDNNPVLFVEHRWLHPTESEEAMLDNWRSADLQSAKVVRQGKDITLAGWGYSIVECLNAAQALSKVGIEAEVIDLRVGHTLEMETLIKSVKKTDALLVHDLHQEQMAPAHTVISKALQELSDTLIKPTQFSVVAQPNHPVPTSWHLAQDSYQEAPQIVEQAIKMLGTPEKLTQALEAVSRPPRPDVPNYSFTGPF
jgi:pyruvate dehydrogenase E1 component beta subunit